MLLLLLLLKKSVHRDKESEWMHYGGVCSWPSAHGCYSKLLCSVGRMKQKISVDDSKLERSAAEDLHKDSVEGNPRSLGSDNLL